MPPGPSSPRAGTDPPGDPLADPLAGVLWAAREARRELSAADPAWAGLDRARADAVAAELYERAGATGPAAWKLGLLDRAGQERMGVDRPLVAPVLPAGLRQDTADVTLAAADFVRARFEPEIGLRHTGSGVRLTACVEVADCRFAGWQPPPAGAVADFGLQGAMVFGPPLPDADRVRVEVRHEGQVVTVAEGSVDEAMARLDLLGERWVPGAVVATGALTPLLDARPGRWDFDFGAATLTVRVR